VLSKLPDIERMLTRIFTYSIKTKIRAFYIDIQATKRLAEFETLLNIFKELNEKQKELS